jgi:TonB family protein
MKKFLILFCLTLSLVHGQDSLMFDYAYKVTDNIKNCSYKGVASKISDSLYEVQGKSTKGTMTFFSHYRDSTLKIRHGDFTEKDSSFIWRYYFENGLQNGDSKKYSIEGNLVSKRKFEKGKHVGVDTFYNDKGQLVLTSDLNYSTYNGIIRQYINDVVTKKCEVKDGLFICVECGCDTILPAGLSWGKIAKYNGDVQTDVQRNFRPSSLKVGSGRYEVWVRFRISSIGEVEVIKIGKSSGSREVDRAAIKAVTKLKRYAPAAQNGKPVPMEVTIPIVYIVD